MNVILGAGLAGLTAGYSLSRAGREVTIVEQDRAVGGLAKTVTHNGYRFDLGGHRFITKDRAIDGLVRELLGENLLVVPRKSEIYLRGKYFDYPLKPSNAMFGLGLSTTVKILSDYAREKIRNTHAPGEVVSLEDWVVRHFGRTMYDLYFRQYSEKVWGIDCRNISEEWVSRRISGLSLWEAVKNAFCKLSGKGIDTLADRFLYPRQGIGAIADRLRERVAPGNAVMTGARVERIIHEGSSVRAVTVRSNAGRTDVAGDAFVSTMPLTNLLFMFDPPPPDDVIASALRLHYRDLVIVTLMLDAARVTDLTWLYLPERNIPIGRIHEPNNWSPALSPAGKTQIVAEYFCFRGDRTWGSSDERLIEITRSHLARLGFIRRKDCIDACVVRVPHAYPLLDTCYRAHYRTVMDYLGRFTNLALAGRTGTFQYLNMDHAMRSGIDAADSIIGRVRDTHPEAAPFAESPA